MNILLLAPEPFYQERGTPIAVDLVLKVLSERGDRIDVLTYHEGSDVAYENVTVNRIPRIPFVRGIRPGFSWKKVVCDVFLFPLAILMASRGRYQMVHAVEESVFIALVIKRLHRLPYVYDMDSSLTQGLIEKSRWLGPFGSLLTRFERLAVANAKAVLPVCDALASEIQKYEPQKILVLHDISLLGSPDGATRENLRRQLGIAGLLMMYVGNLEPYQGIDLLLESFAMALKRTDAVDLVIIGGRPRDIKKYQEKSERLGIHHRVHLLEPKPVAHLAAYLSQADILVSPRVSGMNTPMKIYSYLGSGRALLATNLPTHTQVLDGQVAVLVEPTAEEFSEGILRLADDGALRSKLGLAGQKRVKERHTYEVFREKLNGLYEWVATRSADAVGP